MAQAPEITDLYDGAIQLSFSPGRHIYTANGKKVDSITGVLRVINKPALMYWAVNLAIDHLQEKLVAGVALDELQLEELLDGAKTAHRKTSSSSASMGTLTHAWISRYLKGENPPMPVNKQIRNSCMAFKEFEREHNLKVQESERKIYIKSLNIAGTCDAYGTMNGEPVVLDIKTSSAASIYPEAFLQCGGYHLGLEEELGLNIAKHVVVACGLDGTLNFHVSERTQRNKDGFIAAATLQKALKELESELK